MRSIPPILLGSLLLFWVSAARTLVAAEDIVINEINYAPSAAAENTLKYEYVELYNRGLAPVSIVGWTLRDLNAVNADEVLYTFASLSIPPSAFLTVYANGATGVLTEDVDFSDLSGRLIAGTTWSGSAVLSNAGDAVQVYSAVPFPEIVDFVYYDEANTGDAAVDDDAVARGIWKDGAAVDTLSSSTIGRAIALRTDGAAPHEVGAAADAEDLDWMQYDSATGGTPGRPNLSGDYNRNGVVDAADYIVWRKGLSTGYTQNEYGVWRSHFGQSSGSGSGANANAAVPEPATLVLLTFAAAGWYLGRRGPNRKSR